MLTLEEVKNDAAIRTYIQRADESLIALGFTEHSFPHVTMVAQTAGYIPPGLWKWPGLPGISTISGTWSTALIIPSPAPSWRSACWTIWTVIPRKLPPLSRPSETTMREPDSRSTLWLALILADKSDVRRSRVRNPDPASFDIHDRVNYSVKKAQLKINEEHTLIKLKLSVDTRYGSVMDYFEIFMQRMLLCRKAAEKLGLQFKLMINEQQLI